MSICIYDEFVSRCRKESNYMERPSDVEEGFGTVCPFCLHWSPWAEPECHVCGFTIWGAENE